MKCGSTYRLSVHHKVKIAEFINAEKTAINYKKSNHLDNLETLCDPCHRVADGHAPMRGFTYLK